MRKDRKKMVTCGAITSRKLALSSPMSELIYWRIYFASDNYGTMPADPWDVLQIALPGKHGVQELDVIAALEELDDSGLVMRWEVDGVEWIHVLHHDRHQSAEFIRKRGFQATPMPPGWVVRESKGRLVKAGPTPDHGQTSGLEGRTYAGLNDDKAGLNASRSAPSLVTSQLATAKAAAMPPRSILECKSKLGYLAPKVGDLVEAVGAFRCKQLTTTQQLRDWYQPAISLDAVYGSAVVAKALRLAIEQDGNSMRWVEAVCKRIADEQRGGIVPVVVPSNSPPPEAAAFHRLLAEDEAEGVA